VRILSKYILLEIFSFFAISLAAFTGLLLTIRMLRLTSLIVNRGVAYGEIARVFIAVVPTFLEIAIPMSALLGVMLAFSRLCGDSELIVIKASGVSLYSFVRPIAYFAVGVGITSLFVSLVLRPWGFATLSDALFRVARSKATAGLSEGVFNKLGNITLYAESINYANGELSRIIVDDRRSEALRRIVIAKRGRIVADPAQMVITLLLADGTAHELIEKKYTRTEFSTNSINLNPDEIFQSDSSHALVAREMSTTNLLDVITEYKAALASVDTSEKATIQGENVPRTELPKKLRRAEIELGQRFSLPVASFIMAFVGVTLGIMSPRTQKTWGAGISATLGLIVFISYYSLLSVGLALADSGSLPIPIALWFPNVFAAVVTIIMYWNLATERWQSVAEGIISWFTEQWYAISGYAISAWRSAR